MPTEARDYTEQLMKELCTTALAGKHNSFEYIKSVREWYVAHKAKTGLRKIVEIFDEACHKSFNAYCKAVEKGEADFSLLYQFTQFRACRDFYEQELQTIKDMLNEYWTYVDSGNWLNQFLFFKTREFWELHDFRKVQNEKNSNDLHYMF